MILVLLKIFLRRGSTLYVVRGVYSLRVKQEVSRKSTYASSITTISCGLCTYGEVPTYS